MENILFKNEYELTKTYIKNKAERRKLKKGRYLKWNWIHVILQWLIIVDILVFLFLRIGGMDRGFSRTIYGALSFFLLIYSYYIWILRPVIRKRQSYKQLSQSQGEGKLMCEAVFGDDIELRVANMTQTYHYEHICFLDETDESFFITMFPGKTTLHLYKENFTLGSPADLSSFIREKCAEKESLWTERKFYGRLLLMQWHRILMIMALLLYLIVYLTYL